MKERHETYYTLGLHTTAVAGHASVNVVVSAQVRFQPTWLLIPREIAADFLVNDVQINGTSQFVGTGSVPGLVFTKETADILGVELKFAVCEVPSLVVVSVTNQRNVARWFEGCVIGRALEDSHHGG